LTPYRPVAASQGGAEAPAERAPCALTRSFPFRIDGDPEAAGRYLIDEHPAGWSVLHGDFTAPPGYRTRHDPQDLSNQCYCHGDRQEPPRPPMTDHTARAAWVDYAYVLEAERLRVLTNQAGRWRPVAEPAWTDHPDWDVIDQHAQHLRRGW
jgi:hypothetical protein